MESVHHRRPSGIAAWYLTFHSEAGARHSLCCRESRKSDINGIPGMLMSIRSCTSMMATCRIRKGAADPRAVEKLAEWAHAVASTQATIRSDREPGVVQVATAVRDVRRTGNFFAR